MRLIDADVAIKELTDKSHEAAKSAGTDPFWEGIVTARRIVNNLPTIQPEPQWIPCSERMPEDLAEVITTWVNRDPLPYYEFMRDKPFTAVSVHYKGEWYWYSSTCADYLEEYGRNDRDKVDKSIEIIAWMPLPEPYKPNNKQRRTSNE